jgi:tetratricopeptide (TPR) repeat protein
MGLVAGFPDSFGGPSQVVSLPKIERIEVQGAGPVGLRLLAARQTLNEAGRAIRRLFDEDLFDADELAERGYLWYRVKHWQQAARDFRRSLARNPDSAAVANVLAWCLVAKPARGDAEEATRWGRVAVRLAPGDLDYKNTLGVALYRSGRFAEAATLLERNAAQGYRLAGYDWVFLAMCRRRLGQAHESVRALTQASRWRAIASGLAPEEIVEFQSFLQEANAVLGESLPDFPSDVFTR